MNEDFSTESLLAWLNQFKSNIVSPEDYKKAKKEINEEMEHFDIEHRAYMARSRESARKCFFNF